MDEELLRLEYIPLSKAVLWDDNPKEHDIGSLVESIWKYGFQDPPKFDSALAALVYGNGRIIAISWGLKEGREPPAGIFVEQESGEWAVPIIFGNDLKSKEIAEAFAIDHNNLSMAGGEFAPWEMMKMWNEVGYVNMLNQLAQMDSLPVTVDYDDLDILQAWAKEPYKGEGDGGPNSKGDRVTHFEFGDLKAELPFDLYQKFTEIVLSRGDIEKVMEESCALLGKSIED